jgi:PAS domain S-box-containing protein
VKKTLKPPHGEEKFRLVVEGSPTGMVMVNREGAIMLVNAQIENLFGYGRNALLGQPIEMLVPERFRGQHPGHRHGFFASPSPRAMGAGRDLYGLRQDGSEFPVEIGLNPIETEDGLMVMASIIDISERKRAEETIRGSEERFRLMVECVTDYAIFMLDPEGHIISWNAGAQRMTGYHADEILGRHLSCLYTPEDIEKGKPDLELNTAIRTGRFEDEGWRVRKDGSRFWANVVVTGMLDEAGRVNGFSKVTRDLTQRRQAEEKFRLVVEASPTGMVMVDQAGRMLLVNAQIERLFGYARVDLLEQPIEILVPERFRGQHPGHRHGFFASPSPRAMGAGRDLYGLRKDGSEFPVEIGLNPIQTAEGIVVMASIIDISERKRTEMALQASEERFRIIATEAETANRLKDEFLATMSHELRTPLNSIFGWIRMVRSGMLDHPGTERALESVERGARAQMRIVDDLLDVSRITTGKLRLEIGPVDLPAVIRAAVDAISPAAELKGVSIETLLDLRADSLLGDSDRLQQVVWNLLSNAVKFTPRNGSVEVRLTRLVSQVEITVRDTGEGISPEFLPFVFDRFSQQEASTARRRGGLGLGLAIVRHFVELHGGRVCVASPGPEKGATFTVRLPLKAIAREEASRTSSSDDRPPAVTGPDDRMVLQGLRVLFVEDEADARALVTTILSRHGAQVTAVASADEGLAQLKQGRQDLLISDIEMPVQDGYALIRLVRTDAAPDIRRIPAIALSAYARSQDRMRALSAGFDDHLAKPFEPTDLTRVISRLMAAQRRA